MRWIAEALWLAAAVVAYGVYGPYIAINGAIPVFPLILIVRVALTHGEIAGNLTGFSGGLLIDAFSAEWFGSTMLIDSLIGYAIGAMRGRIVLDSLLARVIVLLMAAEVHSVGIIMVRAVAGPPLAWSLPVAMGAGLYTALVGAVWWVVSDLGRGILGWRSVWDVER